MYRTVQKNLPAGQVDTPKNLCPKLSFTIPVIRAAASFDKLRILPTKAKAVSYNWYYEK
jgi:hypothetical protein